MTPLLDRTIWFDSSPLPAVEARTRLLKAGVPENRVDRYLASFDDVDSSGHAHAPAGSPEGGRFVSKGEGGGGGAPTKESASESKKQAGPSADQIKAAGQADIDKMVSSMKPVVQSSGVVSRIKSGLFNAAKASAEAASGALATISDVAAHGINYMGLVQGAVAAVSGGHVIPRYDRKTDTAYDKHYDKLKAEYGKTTANLIVTAGNLITAGASYAVGMGVLNHLAGLPGSLVGPGSNMFAHAATVLLGGGAVGALATYTNMGRAIARYIPCKVADLAFKAMGIEKGSEQGQAAAKVRSTVQYMEGGKKKYEIKMSQDEALNYLMEEGITIFADEPTSKSKDDTVNLPPDQIRKLGIAVMSDLLKNFYTSLFTNKEFMTKLVDSMKKDGITQKQLDDHVKSQKSKFYLDGRVVSREDALASFQQAGFSAADANTWVETLEPAII